MDNLHHQILGRAFFWSDSVLNAPDHARAKIATRRFRQEMEYILKNGALPPEGWQPDTPGYPPLDIDLTGHEARFDQHAYNIAGEGVEVETWKGLTPDE